MGGGGAADCRRARRRGERVGVGHWYQGVAGVWGSAVSGLLFGVLYLKGGRNLWLPILAHGFSDTIGLVLIYLGLVKV